MRRSLPGVCCVLLIVLALNVGCGKKRDLIPVAGKVTYKGQPLKFGNVLFQPESGPPAKGEIAADGTYTLTTEGQPGALEGHHRVEVRCLDNQAQRPKPGAEPTAGKSLIPEKYTIYENSGITKDVKKGGGPYDIKLD